MVERFHPAAMRSRFGSCRRCVAAAVHLLFSGLVAAFVVVLVFLVWYPAPFATIAGGTSLFKLLIAVDVILGPSLTLVVASSKKSSRELSRDLFVIIAFQLAGLGYGIYAMALARPVIVSFEVDRFRIVTAADIDSTLLLQAPDLLRSLSWTGPHLIGTIKPTDPSEQLRSIELGLNGVDLSMVPKNWVPFEQVRGVVVRKSRPISVLLKHVPVASDLVAQVATEHGMAPADLRFLPLVSRRASWLVLLSAASAEPLAYLPIDGFF